MPVTVEFYGVLRQVTGTDSLVIDRFAPRVTELLEDLCRRHPELTVHLPRAACAVDDQIVTRDHPLADGSTLALIPPVSGGDA